MGVSEGTLCCGFLLFFKVPSQPPSFCQTSKLQPNYLLQMFGAHSRPIFLLFFVGGTVTKLEFRFKKKKGIEAPTPPQNSYLKFIKEWGTVEKKGLGRGAAVAALKNQGIVVTRSSKHRGYHGCKRLISVCIVHPHIGANSLSLCLQVTIGPHGVFFFSLGISGKTHTIPRWGGQFSCRQIIHGDFVLNEVKLLLSVKQLFQKSQPGLELLPFFSAASLC